VRRGVVRIVLLMTVATCLVVGVTAGVPAGHAGAQGTAVSGKGASPLSPRLLAIAQPSIARLPAAAQAAILGVAPGGPGSLIVDARGRVLVSARFASVAAGTLGRVRAAGGVVTFVDSATRSVTLAVHPRDLTAIGAIPGTQFVGEVLAPEVNGICRTGAFISEGDTQLLASDARSRFHVDGRGVTVGVLSDSYDSLHGAAADVANAELPGTANPCGDIQPVKVVQDDGVTDEGRAMAQIVHDLAPGARIDFATGHGGPEQFAANIRRLARLGAKVIVDDVTYQNEPLYQEGVVGKAVADVVAAGVSYFASAGNFNVIVAGQDVASYEAPSFRPMSCPAAVTAREGGAATLRCQNFATHGAPDSTDSLTFSAGGLFDVALGWDEPQFGVRTDLDLALVNDASGAVVSLANTNNLKSQQAIENLSATVGAGSYSLVVVRFAGKATPRFKLLMYRAKNLTSVEYNPTDTTDTIGPTLAGHVAAIGASTVAAVPYSSSTTVETYSARGPATYCWGPVVGTMPAAALHPCITKQVDIAATTGVQNSFFGSGPLHRFYGTSAAAPHAAAIAALQLEYRSCATPATIRAAQAASGRPVGAFGASAVGSGLLDAVVAVGLTRCGQTIRFGALANRRLGTAPFSIAADSSASSRLAVQFTSVSTRVCRTTRQGRVTLVAVGPCTIRAAQGGNARFAAAQTVSRSFTVLPAAASGASKATGGPGGMGELAPFLA